MNISICIGSACHIKGSYEVIKIFKEYIDRNNLNEFITLKSSFCLGTCSGAVSVQIDDEIISVTPENAERILIKYIKKR